MKPGRFDLPIIWRGSDYAPIAFTWLDVDGNPLDLTGFQPLAQSRRINFHPVIEDPSSGIATISLNKTETSNLRLGVEPWDWVWINSGTGTKTNPLIFGFVEIKEPVSKTLQVPT